MLVAGWDSIHQPLHWDSIEWSPIPRHLYICITWTDFRTGSFLKRMFYIPLGGSGQTMFWPIHIPSSHDTSNQSEPTLHVTFILSPSLYERRRFWMVESIGTAGALQEAWWWRNCGENICKQSYSSSSSSSSFIQNHTKTWYNLLHEKETGNSTIINI